MKVKINSVLSLRNEVGYSKYLTIIIILVLLHIGNFSKGQSDSLIANVNTYYRTTGGEQTTDFIKGRFGRNSKRVSEWGLVVHVKTLDDENHGCTPPVNVPNEQWIALVERGNCKFTEKITNAAIIKNASAVVIYNHEAGQDNIVSMHHEAGGVVSLFIGRSDGQRVSRLVDNGTKVMMYVTVDGMTTENFQDIMKTTPTTTIPTTTPATTTIPTTTPTTTTTATTTTAATTTTTEAVTPAITLPATTTDGATTTQSKIDETTFSSQNQPNTGSTQQEMNTHNTSKHVSPSSVNQEFPKDETSVKLSAATLTAIIVVVCILLAAVLVGFFGYRRFKRPRVPYSRVDEAPLVKFSPERA